MQKSTIININELRIKLDQLNEKIISGLKTRSKYPVNFGIYTKKFCNNESWFFYRLKKEQDIDSEFGRFLYHDQAPFVFSKNELSKSKVIKAATNIGAEPIIVDYSKEIILAYQEIVSKLCPKEDEESFYGETTKLDVENILTINERILGIGEQVAAYKI
jgi:hypothetical protein